MWHRRLGHTSMDLLHKLNKHALVKGLPKTKFVKDKICDACQLGKQHKTSFPKKKYISTSRPLQLLHMDLFGPNRVASLGGKLYAFVIVDDFSRFTWVLFLTHKNEAHIAFVKFCKKAQNEIGCTITSIRSDRGREFDNHDIEKYCDDHGFTHNFSAPRTPQQNGAVERKNRSLQEMARTMLNEHSLPKYFWAEAVNTACYIINRVVIRSKLEKTPYELWKGRTPNIGYFKVFGCKCFILNDKDNLGKFDAKSDEGIFLGYSMNSKAYRVYNKRSLTIEESMHVVFDEVDSLKPKNIDDDDNDFNVIENKVNNIKLRDQISQDSNKEERVKNASHLEQDQQFPKSWRTVKDHPIDQILGDPSQGVNTRSSLRNVCNNMAFVLEIEPKNIEEAETDEFWLIAMEEEFNQSKYIKDLLKKFGIKKSKIYTTPINSTTKLDKDENGKNVDIKQYRGMIGSLLYLTASRPDIMFSVCLCARFQSCLKESHLIAVKRIFRYLLGTIDLGLWYPKFTSLDLVSYSDADFAGCKIDRKSISGTCHFLGHSLVSWFSKKQNSVALSTAEAEYIAAGSCCAQVLYMKQQLEDFKLKFDHIPIRCDNTSAINISKNPILHSRTKHIEIRHHFIRDHVQKEM